MAACYLTWHLHTVQIVRHEELSAKAKRTYTRHTTVKGKRGQIYDRKGNVLIGNIPVKEIYADPQFIPSRAMAVKIADYFKEKLNFSEEKRSRLVRDLMNKKAINSAGKVIDDHYAFIARNVEFELSQQMELETKQFGLSRYALTFREEFKRYYPKDELLSNILGFTNSEASGVTGIESKLDESMSSKGFKQQYERSSAGVPFSYGISKTENIENGNNVYLTVEEPVQAIVEEELDKLMAEWTPKAAFAIMADPYTGDLLAVAQRPTFNPNDRSTYKQELYKNRIVGSIFEPGSTMKPVVIAQAIDSGLVTPDTKIDCEGGYWKQYKLRDSHEHEKMTVSEIIQVSSNIGTAKIAVQMGKKKLYETLYNFGFGQKTGVKLAGETRGLLPHYNKWYPIKTTRACIGQGINVTPLQLVRSYCALANGGYLPELRIIDRIEDPNTQEFEKIPYGPKVKLYNNPWTHKKVIDMMKLVTMKGGTAENVAMDGYYTAGKTGTSQKIINGRYSQTKFYASFIGFVPADRPKFVLLVMADEPQKRHWGGTVAGPTFKNISERVLKYYNVQPDYFYENED